MDTAVDTFHVSPQQEQLWLAEPEGPTARVQGVIALDGAVDPETVRAALRGVVERHESLRTSFVRQAGLRVPLQAVHERLDPAWEVLETGDTDARERARAAELTAPLDPTAGPLLRALLLRVAPERHELVLTASALIADAGSLSLIAQELAASLIGGDLVEEPLQYADFAAWQREQLDSGEDEARAAAESWRELESAAAPRLPFPRTAEGPFASDFVPVELGPETARGLADVAARYGVDLAVVVQAAWQAALGSYSGEGEVTIALENAERRHADLEGAIGAYSRPVPVQAFIGPDLTVAELLHALERAREQALVLQDYAPGDHSPAALPAYVEAPSVQASGAGLRLCIESVRSASRHPLALTVLWGDGALALELSHDARRHRAAEVRRLAASLATLLASIAQSPASRVGELELLDQAQRRHLLTELGAASGAASGTVSELVATHAQRAPGRIAVADAVGQITYQELEQRANQLAHRLIRAGVGPDVTVGLLTERSVDMVIAMLGILRAGGAYVPLHADHPPARLAHQLATAGARAVVTQQSLLGQLPAFAGEIVCLDRDAAALAAEATEAPPVELRPEHLAYVIFTSGSTGTPKGVMVTHGNVANYAQAIAARLGADREPLSFATVTSIATDLGNTAVFGALCSGGTLVLVDQPTAGDPGALARAFAATSVDVLKITPSHLAALLAGGDAGVLPRRWLVLGGERAPWELIDRVRALGSCQILNHYGPTETTIGSCTFLVGDGPGEYEPASVPIGAPLAGTTCYVLDAAGRPAPVGARGTLFIGGAGVARGYAAAPELTAERFLPDPFAGVEGARMYDTGDIVRWLPDGALEFLGRLDEQVKIRGYRVEPAEVETALRSHAHVVEAAVVARPGAAGELRLVAYCAVTNGTGEAELQAHAAQWLPEYMRPAAIVALERLPQTPSGKIDRQALPDPEEASAETSHFVAPRTPMEEAVAAVWSHVLGLPSVGVEDDFFALGGHSLLATQVVAQIRSDFAVDLPLHSLFTFPTVAALTAEVVQMMGDADDEETARLMAELEGMSDEEAERLLKGDAAQG